MKQKARQITQINGKIDLENVRTWMKANAYEQSTIRQRIKKLKHLMKSVTDITNPETVKLFIADKKCENSYKQNLVEAYDIYLQSEGLEWNRPFYQRYEKKRKSPKEEHIDFLINHARPVLAMKLSISKDLGQRPVELTWLTLKDIDLTTGLVQIRGAKHTKGREGQLKAKSVDLIKLQIDKGQLTQTDHIYNGSSDNLSTDYRHYRNRVAKEYNMPELKQIQLYDFRRFKASKIYHLTRDILYVKEILGHKDNSLRSTLKYISLFDERNITWIPVICRNQVEIAQAIKDDCTLVCQADGITYFRKPA
ncbi:MAG: tyrosine-type recombinase/integrase [Candidatus Bathyarchaeia archaeon]|jgi:integrase